MVDKRKRQKQQPLPLTPALSQREREQQHKHHVKQGGCNSTVQESQPRLGSLFFVCIRAFRGHLFNRVKLGVKSLYGFYIMFFFRVFPCASVAKKSFDLKKPTDSAGLKIDYYPQGENGRDPVTQYLYVDD